MLETTNAPTGFEDAIRQLAERDEKIERLQNDLRIIKNQLRLLLRRNFGPRSERFFDPPGQLSLFGSTPVELAPKEDAAAENDSAAGKRSKRNGRSALPDGLPRERVLIDVDEQDRQCKDCPPGTPPMKKIGEDITEELHYESAKLWVKELVRPKYACATHPVGVVTAPLPPRIIEKGRPGASLLVFLVIAKYADHLPLYRIEKIFRRQGMKINRTTLCDWVGAVVDALSVLVVLMKGALLKSNYLQVDDTPAKARDPTVKKRHRQVYFFVYSRPWGDVVFDYRKSRSSEGPIDFLSDFRGTLQMDEYSGYDPVFRDGTRIRAGCWAHARRKFKEAEHEEPTRCEDVILTLGPLFHLETLMRKKGRTSEQRLRIRQRFFAPVLAQLKKSFQAELEDPAILPRHSYSVAIRYALNNWENLEQFLKDGEVEMDNNSVENALRPLAIGRKNWLHIGHVDAGDRAAVLYTLIVSCNRLGINVQHYLADVLERLPSHPRDRLWELTPRGWLEAQAQNPSNSN